MKPPKEKTKSKIQEKWWSSPGVVYFFGAGNPPKAIKIGVAAITQEGKLKEGVHRRLKQVQTSNHEIIELLGIILFEKGRYPTRDAEILERELHTRFASLQRFKAHTRGAEWFTTSQELLDYIKENAVSPSELNLPSTVASPADHI